MAARENGAHIHPHTRCVSARRSKGLWHLHLERRDGSLYSIRARALVNAAGPWVDRFLREELRQKPPYGIRLIQGSHLIVPRLYDGEHAYILQNEDRRIVFAIPYLRQFTLIGTTDREYQGDPAQISISEAETDYLLNVVNAHFKRQLSRQDILRSFSGVRPLCDDESDDPSAVTRDYTLALDNTPGEAPLLSVFGGKLTTYRKLAEAALEQLAPHFAGVMKASWTASSPLPGGEAMTTVEDLAIQLMERLRQLDPALARRWASTYGSRIWKLLDGAHNLSELGEHLGAGLYAREVEYLVREEWARDADDILWRRTKLGLFLNAQQQHQLQRHLTPESPALPSASTA